jgi:hypothetical protein
LEPLTVPFAPRAPLAHWSLKSGTVALPGIGPEAARGVLCPHTPIFPMLDTCDRAAVSRCWRAIRTHFLPLGPPVGQPEEPEEEDGEGDDAELHGHHHQNPGGGGGLLRLPPPASPMLSASSASSSWQQRGVAHLLPFAAKHPSVLDQRRAGSQWCGPLTLHGLSRWLNARGEKFPGNGFPYDEVCASVDLARATLPWTKSRLFISGVFFWRRYL